MQGRAAAFRSHFETPDPRADRCFFFPPQPPQRLPNRNRQIQREREGARDGVQRRWRQPQIRAASPWGGGAQGRRRPALPAVPVGRRAGRVGRGVRPRRDGRRGHPRPRVPSQEAGLHLLRRRQRRIQHQVRRPTRLILFLLGFSPVRWSNSPAFTPVCCFSSFLPFSSPIRSIRPFSASTGPSDHRRRRPTPSCLGPFAEDECPPQQVLFPPSLPFLLCKTEHPAPNPIRI